jgi:GxxExxY protein
MTLFYEERTKLLIGGFFEVQNEVGLGRDEEAYHRACKLWFAAQGIPAASKPPLPLRLRGQEVYVLFPDFVVWDEITIELKALPRKLGPAEELQLFDYLRARPCRLGMLVNFGLNRVHFERRIYDPPETTLVEDWSYWSGAVTGRDREIGLAIRSALRSVYDAHRTGYGAEVVEKLVLSALRLEGLSVVERPVAKAFFHDIEVHESALDCFVIEGRFVLSLTALFEDNEFNMSFGLSHLRTLDLPWGVAVNFGRTEVEIAGLRNQTRNIAARMARSEHG